MSPDRALWDFAKTIEGEENFPSPRCPRCGKGTVSFRPPTEHTTAATRALRESDFWEPEQWTGTFVAVGPCGASRCQQIVTAAGDWWTDMRSYSVPHGSRSDQYTSFYRVSQFFPTLKIIELPSAPLIDAALGGIEDDLRTAGAVLFQNPGLAATALRRCVERFLSNQGVPNRTPTGGFRPLAQRLKEWRQKDASHEGVADLMNAVRWLGNDGTHEDGALSATDVLDGASILGEGFHRLYVSPTITAAAAEINGRKGVR